MIKLKDIIIEIHQGQQIDLGDNYILKRTAKDIFKVYTNTGELAASIMITIMDDFNHKLKIPYVNQVFITNKHRGKGLYRRTLPILKNIFGAIRSDNRGGISNDACRAWIEVGARNILDTDNQNVYGGSWFVLEK